MSDRRYPGNPYRYTPLSPWAHIGYTVLFALPVLGLIFLIIYSFDNSNINRRNYARSFWCWVLFVIVLIIVAGTGAFGLLVEQARTALRSAEIELPFLPDDAPVTPSAAPTLVAAYHQTAAPAARVTSAPTAAPTEKPAPSNEDTSRQFRAVIDSYEAFFDEYVAFMKKYEESDPSFSMIADYFDFLSRYASTMEALEEIQEEDVSAADWAYYMAAHARIMRKLDELAE